MDATENARTTGSEQPRPAKRIKRSFVACRRCHSQKSKCSGEAPCNACVAAGKRDSCEYPFRERKVTISEHYLKQLEADSEELRRSRSGIQSRTATPASPAVVRAVSPTKATDTEAARTSGSADEPSPNDIEVVNPLFENGSGTHRGPRRSDSEPPMERPFLGEAACDAFGNLLLQYVDKSGATAKRGPPPSVFVRREQLRLRERPVSATEYTGMLPDRIQAKLLLQVAMRFIGNGQFLCLKRTFMREVDELYLSRAGHDKSLDTFHVYDSGSHGNGETVPDPPSICWVCKFFTLLALGEMYANHRSHRDRHHVPGEDYFAKALDLVRFGLYEEATPLQVEVYTLFAWYSNSLGRIRSAYTFLGIAMRLALSLGMHRSTSAPYVSPVEREERRRIWWSLYLFDRLTCSKLGQPVSVSDDDIDLPLPSMDGLTPQEQEEFMDPAHLAASVGLARIAGDILTDIYCLPGRNKGTFVQRVHRILTSLRRWDEQLPRHLFFDCDGDSANRHVASLQLCYNQCIIHTTRPILLFLFRTQFDLDARSNNTASAAAAHRPFSFSPMTTALAKSCVNAAHTSNKILAKLFVDGTLATLGYWDAHYLFSSSLILVMSAVMEPNVAVSDGVQTAFSLLKSMREDGNIPAHRFCEQLALIQKSVSELRASAAVASRQTQPRSQQEQHRTARRSTEARDAGESARMAPSGNVHTEPSTAAASSTATAPFPLSTPAASTHEGLDYLRFDNYDALANPHIHDFLAEEDFAAHVSTFPDGSSLRQFVIELGDSFIFPEGGSTGDGSYMNF